MKRVLFTALLVLVSTPAAAADRFDEMDADKDDKVVVQEFTKAMPQMRESAFAIIDANKDGAISREEWQAFRGNHGKEGTSGVMPAGTMPGMPPSASQAMPGQADPTNPRADLPLIQPPKK